MICSDVQTLARAAPEPAATPRVNLGDVGNSFDQFLQVATSDNVKSAKPPVETRTTDRETARVEDQPETKNPVEARSENRKTDNNAKAADKPAEETAEKPVDENESTETPVDQTDSEAAEEEIQAAAAAVLAMQAAVVVPSIQQQPEAVVKTDDTTETVVPQAAVPVMENSQSTVIQIPETDPQPLPDELKQAIQQPKVETKEFQPLVDAAAQNLENKGAATETIMMTTAQTTQVEESHELQKLDTQEPTVKVVDLSMQTEDMAEIDSGKTTANIYAMASLKTTENLVQPKSLPIIQKVSTEVAELVREQGQSMRVQIHPENLGKIDLRLVSNSDGMKVVITAEVPATARLLETHLDQLQRSLSNAGVSISGMSVNSQGAQSQSANTSAGQNTQGHTGTVQTNFLPETDEITTPTVGIGSSSLDYRI
ncbi:MAG: flagellar hook-length control protein FliK [Leptolinea sp.]|jgi:flagellar hook-length control protein FliK|nr:flagellar hook-length control protein FliK [Leptolinea sp.]